MIQRGQKGEQRRIALKPQCYRYRSAVDTGHNHSFGLRQTATAQPLPINDCPRASNDSTVRPTGSLFRRCSSSGIVYEHFVPPRGLEL